MDSFLFMMLSDTTEIEKFRDYAPNLHQSVDCAKKDCNVLKFLNGLRVKMTQKKRRAIS